MPAQSRLPGTAQGSPGTTATAGDRGCPLRLRSAGLARSGCSPPPSWLFIVFHSGFSSAPNPRVTKSENAALPPCSSPPSPVSPSVASPPRPADLLHPTTGENRIRSPRNVGFPALSAADGLWKQAEGTFGHGKGRTVSRRGDLTTRCGPPSHPDLGRIRSRQHLCALRCDYGLSLPGAGGWVHRGVRGAQRGFLVSSSAPPTLPHEQCSSASTGLGRRSRCPSPGYLRGVARSAPPGLLSAPGRPLQRKLRAGLKVGVRS